MKCEYIAVKTLYLLVPLFRAAQGDMSDTILNGGRTKNECYRAEFSEDVWSCPDFDNEVMKCDPLELGMVDGKDGELGLQGRLELNSDIEEGATMNVDIWKIMDIGKEYLYHAQGDICSSLNDKNTPWFPMIDAMKIIECPIVVKNYDIKDMVISLEYAKDMITHEMCGEYIVQLSIMRDLEKLTCHELGIALSEYSCNATEDSE